MAQESYKLVIVGGGTAGISVAARLIKKSEFSNGDIAVIDPSDKHYYQPLWTLVGAGVYTIEDSERDEASLIPKGVEWIKDSVTTFSPDQNSIQLASGKQIGYEYLVVAAGIQIDWNKIKGLEGNLGKNGICSNYDKHYAEKTWEFLRSSKEGDALLFTQPPMPIKCAGAPQKIFYLAEDYIRKQGLKGKVKLDFNLAGPGIFGVPKYKAALEKLLDERDLHPSYEHNLVEVRAEENIAVFDHKGARVEKPFDFLHVVPPMSSPDFIKSSPLADSEGWVDVDKFTTQHNTYKNVFSLGDCSSLPTSRTGAAVRKQVPVTVKNLISVMNQEEPSAKYNGYASCPLVTSYNTCMLAEFGYDGEVMETFPFDQAKERKSMYLLKTIVLPKLYWHGMLKGRA